MWKKHIVVDNIKIFEDEPNFQALENEYFSSLPHTKNWKMVFEKLKGQ
jgi:hypothetical protein